MNWKLHNIGCMSDNSHSSSGASEFDPVESIPGDENLLDATPVTPGIPFSQRRNPRVYIAKEVVDKLVRLGVSDEAGAIGRAVSSITDLAISVGLAWLPDATDAIVIEKAIADRLQELSALHLGLLKLLTDLESAAEYKTLLQTFKQMGCDEEIKQ